MHLLVPFASALGDAAVATLRDLALPNLGRLLARLDAADRVGTDEYSLTPPHERAFASAVGWRGEDGTLPFAAWHAAHDGVPTDDAPWGLLTPTHWHVGAEQVSLVDPDELALGADESRELFDAIRPLFEEIGWRLAWGAPTRWYAAHETLDGLPCASIDRASGRNVDLWLADHPQARLLRRLQSEVQMVLYRHPRHDERSARGALPVNSFWLSGCGRAQPVNEPAAPQVDLRLRAPLVAGYWAGWAEAWRALDAGPIAEALARAERGEPVRLTLAGERQAQTFASRPRAVWQRIASRWRRTEPAALLESL